MNPVQHPSSQAESLLKRTTSRCPVCHAACPAEVWRVEGQPAQVFLKRTCPEHGEASVCIASDARFYWLAKGNPENASGCCGAAACCASDGSAAGTLGRNVSGRGNAPFEKLSTCLALIEIVNSCNLSCPTCYADSPLGAGRNVDAVPLADLQRHGIHIATCTQRRIGVAGRTTQIARVDDFDQRQAGGKLFKRSIAPAG